MVIQDQSGADDFAARPDVPVLVPSVSADEVGTVDQIFCMPRHLTLAG